jgi:hypothetical protein
MKARIAPANKLRLIYLVVRYELFRGCEHVNCLSSVFTRYIVLHVVAKVLEEGIASIIHTLMFYLPLCSV